ncbi:MAG TPA: hypothetical protein ENI64_11075 [Gammaproteobacteria bacterium]|nr:hypothetical protein [Gammaproteobacteria bacterium]
MLTDFFSLPVGLVLETMLFFLLYRLSPLNGVQAALVALLLTLAIFLPYSLLHWSSIDVFVLHITVFSVAAYLAGVVMRGGKDVRRRFHWAPALIVLFFVVIIVVDSVFVTMSVRGLPDSLQEAILPAPRSEHRISTIFPGVVPDNNYQKESRFNAYISQREDQKARAWKIRKGWLQGTPVVGQEAVFQVQLQDRQSRPLTGLTMKGRFLRPANSRLDVDFSMNEVSPGIYRVAIALSVAGVWNLQLNALDGEIQMYEIKASTTIADK